MIALATLATLQVLGCAEGGELVVIAGRPAPTTTAPTEPAPSSPAPTSAPPSPPPNVLILLTDDQGVDQVAAYGEHPLPPPTPNLDALAARGRLFRTVYASPVCSPTRASILTGRMPRRTGVGTVIQSYMPIELPLAEVLIPELTSLADPPWSSAAIGKWHLAGVDSPHGGDHPVLQGFGSFRGSLGNLYDTRTGRLAFDDYYHWEETTAIAGEPAETALNERYATTVTADDAIDAITTLPEPWFVYVAFNAAHEPLDPPPADLCPTMGAVSPTASKAVRYRALIEAVDTEIGRVLAAVDPARTDVVFLSDNGTPGHATLEPWVSTRAKDTLFEGGVRVPMIVAGPDVAAPGVETGALVHVVDLLPTIAELAGVPLPDGVELDGSSLVPLLRDPDAAWPRTVVHTEEFGPPGPGPYLNDERASRDASFKVIEAAQIGLSFVWDVRDGVDDGQPVATAVDDGPAIPSEPISAADQDAIDALIDTHRAYFGALAQ